MALSCGPSRCAREGHDRRPPGPRQDPHVARGSAPIALEDLDGRRLAGAVRAQEGEDLAALDLEVEPCDRLDLAVALAQPFDRDGGSARSIVDRRACRHGSSFAADAHPGIRRSDRAADEPGVSRRRVCRGASGRRSAGGGMQPGGRCRGDERRLDGAADLGRVAAPGVEAAGRGRRGGARRVAAEDDRSRPGSAPSTAGTAERSASVYGWIGRVSSSSAGESSTSLPRYMTATRSETWRTTFRSCAMKRYVRPNSSCRSSSRFRICAWIDTSRAETGSSATTSRGVVASARAIPTR